MKSAERIMSIDNLGKPYRLSHQNPSEVKVDHRDGPPKQGSSITNSTSYLGCIQAPSIFCNQ
jgi:hypothetical protein